MDFPYSTITNPRALACAVANAAAFASNNENMPTLCCVEITATDREVQLVTNDTTCLLVQKLRVAAVPPMDHTVGTDSWSALIDAQQLAMLTRAVLRGVKDRPADIIRTDDGVVVRCLEREVHVPQYDESPYADWQKFVTGEIAPVDTIQFSTHTLRKIAALRLPNVKRDAVCTTWRFNGERKPVAFACESYDDELDFHGLIAPVISVGDE